MCVCVFVRECVCVSLGVIYSGQKIERERKRDKIESKRDKEKRKKESCQVLILQFLQMFLYSK